jgi:hypothetical protein
MNPRDNIISDGDDEMSRSGLLMKEMDVACLLNYVDRMFAMVQVALLENLTHGSQLLGSGQGPACLVERESSFPPGGGRRLLSATNARLIATQRVGDHRYT